MDSNESTRPRGSGHRKKRAHTHPLVVISIKRRLFSRNPKVPRSAPSFRSTSNDNNSASSFEKVLNIPPSDVILKLAEHVISKQGTDSNVVFSPLSLNVVMALVAAGTNGGTLKELLSYFKADSLKALNSYFARLISTVFADGDGINSDNEGPIILFSNSVWLHKDLRLKNRFKKIVESYYQTTLDLVDFQKGKEVVEKVNSRVAEQTRGLIKEILPPNAVTPDDRAILVNATYFKGEWEEKFNKSLSKDHDFYCLDGSVIQVPFMSSNHIENYSLCICDGLKVLGLPYKCGETDDYSDMYDTDDYSDMYKQNRRFTMYFILPDSNTGLPDLVQTMGKEPGFLESHTGHTPGYKLANVRIPKFKFSTEFEASNILGNKLGLCKVFDKSGFIGEMVENDIPLYVSKVVHKACVEVNEYGVEAVAVTVARETLGCPRRFKPPCIKYIDFVADHPFIFVIREENTKTILFIGQVNSPMVFDRASFQ